MDIKPKKQIYDIFKVEIKSDHNEDIPSEITSV